MDAAVSRIESFRDFYARLIVAAAGVSSDANRLISAFRSVPRERFVGPGPWSVFTPVGYVQTQIDDTAILYQDIVVSLVEGGPINNGQPSLHAACLAALELKVGETGLHVGAGTGYYTEILALLVGPQGHIHTYEIEPLLAERAKQNLAGTSQVIVHCRSGSDAPLPACDFVYVNAGTTHPADAWLDALNPGGRLLFPLTPSQGFGGMLLLTRVAVDEFKAKFVCPAMFIPCVGCRDENLANKLSEAFQMGTIWGASSLRRNTQPDASNCFAAANWWLSTATV
jgi:protein-L-isoaspartate(D-aspartate) O-methyltransferase